jgi:hypothetical protein
MIIASTTDAIAQVSALATPAALSAWSAASDFLIVIILLALFFFFARYAGRGPFVGVLLALYSAYALYAVFPYVSFLPTAPAMTALFAHVGLYAAFVIAFYLILRRVVVSDFLYVGTFGLIVLSFLASAFLLALAYHVFPVAEVYRFTPAIDALFAPEKYFFWWFAAPAVGLFFFAH